MKRRHLLLVALSLILSVCMCLGLAGCSRKVKTLDTPVVTISDDGTAAWETVANAGGYAYKIDNGEEQATDKTSVTLADGQSIVVKAVSKSKYYKDSSWSDSKTYQKPTSSSTLSTPVVSISASGLASWTADTNASGYKYKIDNGEEKTANGTSVQLENGQSIVVKAVGNGTTYLDSAWSESKTYTASPSAIKLTTPTVEISESGLASWTKDDNAVEYCVKVNGTELTTEANTYQLSKNDTIQVMAIGDGKNYSNSDWSELKTYVVVQSQKLNVPTVTISETGLASWTKDANASKYVVSVNGTESETTDSSCQLVSRPPGYGRLPARCSGKTLCPRFPPARCQNEPV